MVKFLLGFLSLFIFSASFAVDYHSQVGQTDPNNLASWDINPTGGGGAPPNFTTAGDRFIIQTGHTMTTTAVWTIGAAGSFLQIQNGATLQGDHLIQFTGTFQIDASGTYIHNNDGSIAQTPAGSSIFSGTESFASSSNFEIRNWQTGPIQPLPNSAPGIVWGNLIINLIANLGGAWNWTIIDGGTLTINGNLDIRSTHVGSPARELRFTGDGNQTINVGGDLLISGNSLVSLKNNAAGDATGNVTMQVEGDISISGTAQLSLGFLVGGAIVGIYDLRFRGNFSATTGTSIGTFTDNAYLVANGTTPQTLSCIPSMNCSFRVAPSSTVNLVSAFTGGTSRFLAILLGAVFNQNGNAMTINGRLESAGGTFNGSGAFTVGIHCTACSGTGNYNDVNFSWCTPLFSGTPGTVNFTNSTIFLNNNISATRLGAGTNIGGSPGYVYFVNSTATTIGITFGATYLLDANNSIFSLDGNSYIAGANAGYGARGGRLRIGSPDGITALPDVTTGNVRTAALRNYEVAGINSFEYFGTTPQVTGDGLPETIAGTLMINNSSGLGTTGVTLTRHTTVSGTLNLTLGKLTSTLSNLITVAHGASVVNNIGSFVDGHMKKIGNTDFTFTIGEGNEFAPIRISSGTGALPTDAFIAKYDRGNPRIVVGTPYENPPINHMSVLEWWTLDRAVGNATKNVTLQSRTYTEATLLADLRVLRWDGALWVNEGNTAFMGSPANGYVTSNVVSGFFAANTPTPFTFGSINSAENPLPVNLISFDALKLNSTKSLLNWELAACCSARAKFEIQRAGNNSNFITVGMTGGSETNRFYNYTDNGLKTGLNYYRLKMTDADGTITYSRTVAIMNGVEGLLITSLIPTIINNTTTLTIASSKEQKVGLIIVDMQGRLMQKQHHSISAGNTTIQLSMERLGAGIYQVFAVSAEGRTRGVRFIKE